MSPGVTTTFDANGIEMAFAVNHLNHALLFFLLKEKNLLAQKCRIIFETTALHDPKQPLNQTPPHWKSTEAVAKAADSQNTMLGAGVRYSNAKLAVVFFGYALASKLASDGSNKHWTVIVYEPGFVPSGGSRLSRGWCFWQIDDDRLLISYTDQPFYIRFILGYIVPWMFWYFNGQGIVTSTPQISGKALADLASGRTFSDGSSGKYILLDKEWRSSEESYDVAKQEECWRWTVEYLGKDAAQRKRFNAL